MPDTNPVITLSPPATSPDKTPPWEAFSSRNFSCLLAAYLSSPVSNAAPLLTPPLAVPTKANIYLETK